MNRSQLLPFEVAELPRRTRRGALPHNLVSLAVLAGGLALAFYVAFGGH